MLELPGEAYGMEGPEALLPAGGGGAGHLFVLRDRRDGPGLVGDVMRYMVVFTNVAEEEAEANIHSAYPFWTIKLTAQNAKDARHKAWKAVNRRPGCRFIKRWGWRICHVGRPEDINAAGPCRCPGISLA